MFLVRNIMKKGLTQLTGKVLTKKINGTTFVLNRAAEGNWLSRTRDLYKLADDGVSLIPLRTSRTNSIIMDQGVRIGKSKVKDCYTIARYKTQYTGSEPMYSMTTRYYNKDGNLLAYNNANKVGSNYNSIVSYKCFEDLTWKKNAGALGEQNLYSHAGRDISGSQYDELLNVRKLDPIYNNVDLIC